MATRPPGPPPPPGGAPMAGGPPPFAGGPPPGAAPPPGGELPGPGPGGGSPEQQLMGGVLGLGKQMEQTLVTFAQAMPEGAKFFQQANELIKQGLAAAMAAASAEQPPTTSPTEPGTSFPGGGFGSAGRP